MREHYGGFRTAGSQLIKNPKVGFNLTHGGGRFLKNESLSNYVKGNFDSSYMDKSSDGYYWNSTEYKGHLLKDSNPMAFFLFGRASGGIDDNYTYKKAALSCRCIMGKKE